MDRNINLNTIDGWENIVNTNAVQRGTVKVNRIAWKRECRLRKMWLTACAIATLGLTFVILGVTGAVADWLATAVSVFAVTTGSFVFGRYVGVKKG